MNEKRRDKINDENHIPCAESSNETNDLQISQLVSIHLAFHFYIPEAVNNSMTPSAFVGHHSESLYVDAKDSAKKRRQFDSANLFIGINC
jgi:hypothetical protein